MSVIVCKLSDTLGLSKSAPFSTITQGIKDSSLFDFLSAKDEVWDQQSNPKIPLANKSNTLYGYNASMSTDKGVKYAVKLIKKAYKNRYGDEL